MKLLAAGKKLKAGDILKPGLAFGWLHPPGPPKRKLSLRPETPLAEIVEESKEEPVEEQKEEQEDVQVESYEYVDEERILENLKDIFGIKEEPRSRKQTKKHKRKAKKNARKRREEQVALESYEPEFELPAVDFTLE